MIILFGWHFCSIMKVLSLVGGVPPNNMSHEYITATVFSLSIGAAFVGEALRKRSEKYTVLKLIIGIFLLVVCIFLIAISGRVVPWLLKYRVLTPLFWSFIVLTIGYFAFSLQGIIELRKKTINMNDLGFRIISFVVYLVSAVSCFFSF